jgi:hypothetical protein
MMARQAKHDAQETAGQARAAGIEAAGVQL